MIELNDENITALRAFLAAFDELTGQWPQVEKHMRDSWGIGDPETAIEEARACLEEMT